MDAATTCSQPKIFIVLPCYNEELGIKDLITELKAVMNDWNVSFTIVAIDDGSYDGTLKILEDEAHSTSIVIHRHSINKGLGAAIQTGLSWTALHSNPADIIVTMDADRSHPPSLIPSMTAMINAGSDVVIASRYRKGSQVIGVPITRRIFSIGASLIFRVLCPVRGVKDYTSGFRVYRASTIQSGVKLWGNRFVSETGFSCMVEILIKLSRLPITFSETPVILRYDKKAGRSKMKVVRTIVSTLILVLKSGCRSSNRM
jgi:dolichol-phosphate mannosyltransferase